MIKAILCCIAGIGLIYLGAYIGYQGETEWSFFFSILTVIIGACVTLAGVLWFIFELAD